MSLINEALKKAQRQRMEDPVPMAPVQAGAPPSGPSASPRIVKRRPPLPARTFILLLGGSVALLLMAGVLAFVFLAADAPPPEPARPPVVAQPTGPMHAPVPPPPAPPVEVAVTLPPLQPTPPASTEPAVTPPTIVATTPQLPVTPVAPPLPPKVAAPVVPTANPRVYEFLETLRISGIRASDTDPKVIMNDRVFRLNDLVDRATQLRLVRVDASTLTFVDATGFEYRKNF